MEMSTDPIGNVSKINHRSAYRFEDNLYAMPTKMGYIIFDKEGFDNFNGIIPQTIKSNINRCIEPELVISSLNTHNIVGGKK